MFDKNDTKWLNDKVERLPNNNNAYRFLCVMLGKKKLTYNQLYLILYALNLKELRKSLEINEIKDKIMLEIFKIYEFNREREE